MRKKTSRTEDGSPRNWGTPAKAATAAAGVLAALILVMRETRTSKSELSSQPDRADQRSAAMTTAPRRGPAGAPEEKPVAGLSLDSLADSKEVQERINRPIAVYVGDPSPFDEVDREDLKSPAAITTVTPSRGIGSARGEQTAEWKGWISGIPTFQTVVVKADDEWQSLWHDHNGYGVPPPPPPEVDFTRDMVIGLFDGTKPTAGYTVDIVDVQTLPDKINIVYRESHPSDGSAFAQILTQPYHLRVIPKTDLPITFEKNP